MESAESSEPQLYFKFKDDSTIPVSYGMDQLSAVVERYVKENKTEIMLNERFIGEAFNDFAKAFFPKHAAELHNLKQSIDKEDWWMECIADHVDLINTARGLYQDDLIRAGNAAADLEFPGFVHACAYVMAEQTEKMKLKDLREYLNEEFDFPDDVKTKIMSCPEYSDL